VDQFANNLKFKVGRGHVAACLRESMSTDESNSRTPSGVAPAWYEATISDFLSVSDNEVLGTLIRRSAAEQEQVRAWQEEITILRRALYGLEGHVILEFDIPRVGSRADAIILIGVLVFVIEGGGENI
jgi:hypothetical protein